ncbi:MAG: hypothetical protein NPIRA05_05710 [Nitrospirales bacterium]|nr:MAG: hypothetical protein NPIRA05_05710 [Nitrospirales bacterium]
MSQREDLIASQNANVAEITLDIHEKSPWHYHTKIAEYVFCLRGHIEVHCGSAGLKICLAPGERYEIKPMVEHRVVNATSAVATYLLVQDGKHDFREISASL